MAETADCPSRILVLGGARSGKSAFAQAQAEASGRDCVFIATAEAFDAEMRDRIARHVEVRGPEWRTVEAPYDLCAALRAEASANRVLMVDCLTLWLGNLTLRGDDVDAATGRLARAVGSLATPIILVSNEVGSGIVPDNALGRRFRDVQGRLNQRMAAACDVVVLVTAGLPRVLKPSPKPTLLLPAGEGGTAKP